MHPRTIFISFVSICILCTGCKSDPNDQPATAANGAAGDAAKHLMESSRNRHDVSPDKMALADPAVPKEVASSTPSAKPYKIGVCLAGINEDFDAAFTAGVNEEAQKRKVTVDIVSADGSATKQAAQMADLQKSKGDAVIVVPVEAQSLGTGVAALKSGKVPVISAGQDVPGAASEVLPDEKKAGQKAMIAIWGGVLKKQSGSVGVIAFQADLIQKARLDGFLQMEVHVGNVKGKFEGYITQNTASAAEAKAAEILKSNPTVSAFFVTDDNLAAGVAKAIVAAKSEALLVSVGANADAREQVKAGKPWFADVIEYPHLMGVTSLDAAIGVLQGDKVPASLVIPVAVVTPASFK